MTRKTDGGKGDRIPGADQAAYEAGYDSINWGVRESAQAPVLDRQVEAGTQGTATEGAPVPDVSGAGEDHSSNGV